MIPKKVFSKRSLNLWVKLLSTSIPSSCKASYISVPKLTTPFGILINPLCTAEPIDCEVDTSLNSSSGIPIDLGISSTIISFSFLPFETIV